MADEAIDEAERHVQAQVQQDDSIDAKYWDESTISSVVAACGGMSNMRTIMQQDIMGTDIYASADNQGSKTTATDHDAQDLIAMLVLEEAAKQQISSIRNDWNTQITSVDVNDVWKT
mmetsp:Transcript_19195/g.46329  ORF Transcript_19195/g.46329 Transcript_19195/m.46329 type:complete len:117 (+) Transcript_19195:807-1157(+)